MKEKRQFDLQGAEELVFRCLDLIFLSVAGARSVWCAHVFPGYVCVFEKVCVSVRVCHYVTRHCVTQCASEMLTCFLAASCPNSSSISILHLLV